MAETKKQGIIAKLFGGKKSCCCNVHIEEVPESEGKAPAAKGAQPSSACGKQTPGASAAGRRQG